MPGIRTSRITTLGLRRLASVTAASPSAASPTTRMFSDRDSDRRRPSRTTSWSSTIRQVMGSLTCTPRVAAFATGELYRQEHGAPLAPTVFPAWLDRWGVLVPSRDPCTIEVSAAIGRLLGA